MGGWGYNPMEKDDSFWKWEAEKSHTELVNTLDQKIKFLEELLNKREEEIKNLKYMFDSKTVRNMALEEAALMIDKRGVTLSIETSLDVVCQYKVIMELLTIAKNIRALKKEE